MDIGIGLPATIPGVKGSMVLDWARRADAASFSSLGIIDRLVYGNYEALTTLAVVAGATQRIRLTSSVMLAPLHNAAVLAKQTATLDALSGGRLTLGMGIGARPDDYVAADVDFTKRGRLLDKNLQVMRRVWAGEPLVEGQRPVGPQVVRKGGPEILLGGYNPKALQRVGKLADGFISGGGADPQRALGTYQMAEQSWHEAGRPGKPRFVACIYVVVGEDLAERAGDYIRDYYKQMGPAADAMAKAIPNTPAAILDKIHGMADIGVDEMILWPTIAELDQVDKLAEIAAKR